MNIFKHNIFRVDTTLESYTYPIVKIVICVLLIIFVVNGKNIFGPDLSLTDGTLIGGIFHLLFIFVGIASLVCIVVSICELLYVSDNRERSKGKSQSAVAKNLKNSKDVPVGSVVALTEECDVIEFEAIAAGRTVRFGASSDYDRGRKVQFFDKEYYVKEKTYKTVEEYEKALRDIAFDGNLKIYRVDGVPVNSYPKLKNAGVDQV